MLSKKNNNNNNNNANTCITNKKKSQSATCSKTKNPKKRTIWKTHTPPPKISLTQVHTPHQNKPITNNLTTKQGSTTSFKDQLILHFPNEKKLNKVKLLLEYFKNIIDENGNIIFPPNINRNLLDVSNVFLTVSAPIHNDEDLDLYRIFINTLNIPKSLIKN